MSFPVVMQTHMNNSGSFSADEVPLSSAFWPNNQYFDLFGDNYDVPDPIGTNYFLPGWPFANGFAVNQNGLQDLSQIAKSNSSCTQVINPVVPIMSLPSSFSPLSQSSDLSEFPFPISDDRKLTLVNNHNNISLYPDLNLSTDKRPQIERGSSIDTGSPQLRAALETEQKGHQLSSFKFERYLTDNFSSLSPAQVDNPWNIEQEPRTAIPDSITKTPVQVHSVLKTKSESVTRREKARTESPHNDTRRTSHNLVERRYRNHLNSHFARLLSILPQEFVNANSSRGVGCVKKRMNEPSTRSGNTPSKRNVLELAVKYIKTLESENRGLVKDKMDLEKKWNKLEYI